MATSVETTMLSPAERRERNRQQMKDSILAAARELMQKNGAAQLNLNEVARRVQLKPQSLAEYFPNKAALYDALFVFGLGLFITADHEAYENHPPGWEQIEAWFSNRLDVSLANPDLFHLVFDSPVPDYIPDERVIELTREVLGQVRGMVTRAIEAGAIAPGVSIAEASDVLLAMRRGLIAERLGKQRFVPPDDPRFRHQLPIVISMMKKAWDPAIPAVSDGQPETTKGGAHA